MHSIVSKLLEVHWTPRDIAKINLFTCPESVKDDFLLHSMQQLLFSNHCIFNASVARKMSCQEFVNNLMELNNGENNYSSEELKRLYEAFKQEPLRWPVQSPMEFGGGKSGFSHP
ncbi:unnamed protein product [Rodentolepis nana]|uniref:SEC7 domain-containing protein n=1 Tax=Rodentolepis nana TaxID=102285 RepID=A0A0R3TPI7_RODNA|nr:unnamed protein product [Rodentolepis nana]